MKQAKMPPYPAFGGSLFAYARISSYQTQSTG